jgi:hypothetical protein
MACELSVHFYGDTVCVIYVLLILTYSFFSFVPHDQASLLNLYGGSDAFVNRLSYMHDQEIT